MGKNLDISFYNQAKGLTDNDPEQIRVVINDLRGATEKEARIAMESALLMEKVLNDLEFKTKVTNPPFIVEYTNGLSLQQIYDKIKSGSTELEPAVDRTANLRVSIYYKRFSRAIGYTYPDTVWQWFNRKFLLDSVSGRITLSSNFLHEYCHKCQFDHPYRGFSRREVPYFYGDSLETVADKFFKNGKLTVASSFM